MVFQPADDREEKKARILQALEDARKDKDKMWIRKLARKTGLLPSTIEYYLRTDLFDAVKLTKRRPVNFQTEIVLVTLVDQQRDVNGNIELDREH